MSFLTVHCCFVESTKWKLSSVYSYKITFRTWGPKPFFSKSCPSNKYYLIHTNYSTLNSPAHCRNLSWVHIPPSMAQVPSVVDMHCPGHSAKRGRGCRCQPPASGWPPSAGYMYTLAAELPCPRTGPPLCGPGPETETSITKRPSPLGPMWHNLDEPHLLSAGLAEALSGLHASSVSPSAQVCFLPSSSEIEPNKDPACQAPTQYLLPETLSRLCGCQKWSWKVFKKVAFSPPSWQCGLMFLIQVAWWSQGPAKTPFKFHLAFAAMLDGKVPIWRDFLG